MGGSRNTNSNLSPMFTQNQSQLDSTRPSNVTKKDSRFHDCAIVWTLLLSKGKSASIKRSVGTFGSMDEALSPTPTHSKPPILNQLLLQKLARCRSFSSSSVSCTTSLQFICYLQTSLKLLNKLLNSTVPIQVARCFSRSTPKSTVSFMLSRGGDRDGESSRRRRREER